MTKKRFVAIGVEWTDGFIQDHIGDRDLFNIGAVCNLLNELSDENEQLKEDINKRIVDYNGLNAEYEWLKEKNEQLKSEIKDFQDLLTQNDTVCHKRVFDCISELIERAKSSNSSNEYKLGAIQVLQTLEKELKGDVE